MKTIKPVIQWQSVMRQPIFHDNELIMNRMCGAYKALTYITGKRKEPPKIKVINPHYIECNHAKIQLTFALKNTNLTLAYIENAVLKHPEKWDTHKYNEALFYLADVISYVIEDIQNMLIKLNI